MATAVAPQKIVSPSKSAAGAAGFAANLCSIWLTIHRWTGQTKVKAAKLTIKTDAGKMEAINVDEGNDYERTPLELEAAEDKTDKEKSEDERKKKKKVTNPRWVVDDYEIFKKIDKIGRAIEATINRYTAGDFNRGSHLLSMSAAPKLVMELTKLRDERRSLVSTLVDNWADFKEYIKLNFPHHYLQIWERLPKPEALLHKFDVEWSLQPLTPVTPEQLDLSNLTPEDRSRLIAESTEMISTIANNRMQGIIDEVFGQVITVCDKINDGSLESGHRKSGALTEILDLLERIGHFKDLAPASVLAQVSKAEKIVRNTTISGLNTDKAVQKAIKEAMAPLAASLKDLKELNAVGTSKAKRTIHGID